MFRMQFFDELTTINHSKSNGVLDIVSGRGIWKLDLVFNYVFCLLQKTMNILEKRENTIVGLMGNYWLGPGAQIC